MVENDMGHAVVFWGDVPVRDGWAFGQKKGNWTNDIFKNDWIKDVELEYADRYDRGDFTRVFRWGGQGIKGKPCRCATDAQIIRCLRDEGTASKHHLKLLGSFKLASFSLLNNCITDSVDAIEGCCLRFPRGKRPWIAALRSEVRSVIELRKFRTTIERRLKRGWYPKIMDDFK